MDELSRLLRDQDGVVARRQVLAAGVSPTEVARALRRGRLVTLVPGVYIEHNGPPTPQQRRQAAVLHAWPAALCLGSALRAAEGPAARDRPESIIHVAVDRDRHLAEVPGIAVHRMSGFAERVQWNASPPRTRYDDSVLDVAAAAPDDLVAVACLADAVGSRRTTAERLLVTLRSRSRIGRRSWLEAVLTDVAHGTCSVLERGYQTEVVRPHGLPPGTLQQLRRTHAGSVVRDVALPAHQVLVELDGWMFHSDPAARSRDLDRDLDAAAEDAALTVRLGYEQVFGHGCWTAGRLARILRRRGWADTPHPCPDCG